MAYLVAVTACVSGVAHTYMAAERLEKLCLLEKWGVSIVDWPPESPDNQYHLFK